MDTKKTPLKMSIRTNRLKDTIKNVYYTSISSIVMKSELFK